MSAVVRVAAWLSARQDAHLGDDLLDYRGGHSLTVGDVEELVVKVRKAHGDLALTDGGSDLLAQVWSDGQASSPGDPNPYIR